MRVQTQATQSIKKKKLLFFHHYGLIGGAGLSGAQVLAAVPKDLFDITVCCSTAAGTQMIEYFRDMGLRVIDGGKTPWGYTHYSGAETPLISRRSLQMLLPVLRDRKHVRAILEQERPDLVVVNSMALFWIGSIAKEFHMPCVCFFRETYAREWLGIRNAVIRRGLSKNFTAMALISENDRKANASVACEKTVICDCVDLARYAAHDRAAARLQLGLSEQRKYLLFVGGFSELKGTHIALSTMLRLPDTDAALVFVGADALIAPEKPQGLRGMLQHLLSLPYRSRCKRMADTLTDRGQLVLFPLQKDIAPFYAAADALIAPSTRPHQLRPIYEAGAAHIPVITTRFDAVKEFADDARAYLAENGDIEGFAAAARAALYTPDAEKIERNYESIAQKNSEEAVRQQTADFFTRLYARLFTNTTEAQA